MNWQCVLSLIIVVGCCLDRSVQADPSTEKNIIRQRADQFRRGKKLAVVIGVKRYLDATIPSLHFCVEDTERIVRVLVFRGRPTR